MRKIGPFAMFFVGVAIGFFIIMGRGWGNLIDATCILACGTFGACLALGEEE